MQMLSVTWGWPKTSLSDRGRTFQQGRRFWPNSDGGLVWFAITAFDISYLHSQDEIDRQIKKPAGCRLSKLYNKVTSEFRQRQLGIHHCWPESRPHASSSRSINSITAICCVTITEPSPAHVYSRPDDPQRDAIK